jgi:hypothetical protein
MKLDHQVPPSGDCTGRWKLRDKDTPMARIECTRCGAYYPPLPEVRVAAVDENYAGMYLDRLTVEGARFI